MEKQEVSNESVAKQIKQAKEQAIFNDSEMAYKEAKKEWNAACKAYSEFKLGPVGLHTACETWMRAIDVYYSKSRPKTVDFEEEAA